MRPAVRDAFYGFSTRFEGDISFLYQDVKGLVSIGVGILADPVELAYPLPLLHDDGTPASRIEIAAEWLNIKNLPPDAQGRTAAQLGWRYAKPHTTLRLDEAGLRSTLDVKLTQADAVMRRRYPEWEDWPTDAQLATLSMCWAIGPAFYIRFPHLDAALRTRDWLTAAEECHMDETGNPGIVPRNKANRILYRNAARAEDPETLYYPRDLWAPPSAPIVDFDIVHPLPDDEPDDAT